LHVQRVTSTKTYTTSSRYDSHTLTAYASGRNDVIFARNRNEEWLRPPLRKEFWDHHYLIRSFVRVCKGRSRPDLDAGSALKLLDNDVALLRASERERWAYGGLFNL